MFMSHYATEVCKCPEKIGLRKKVAKRRFAPRVRTAKKRPQRKTPRYFDFTRARIRLKLTGVIPR